ncbi:hypothetical protein PIB30_033927, partial [Stylosanthes scabra]|nr:hypothetical protein [Stylosanthes scabra]
SSPPPPPVTSPPTLSAVAVSIRSSRHQRRLAVPRRRAGMLLLLSQFSVSHFSQFRSFTCRWCSSSSSHRWWFSPLFKCSTCSLHVCLCSSFFTASCYRGLHTFLVVH